MEFIIKLKTGRESNANPNPETYVDQYHMRDEKKRAVEPYA